MFDFCIYLNKPVTIILDEIGHKDLHQAQPSFFCSVVHSDSLALQ